MTDREEFLGRLRERILRFAASRFGTQAAEDLAQETFVTLLVKYAHVDGEEDLVKLAFAIARNLMMGAARDRGRNREDSVEDRDFVKETPAADEIVFLRQAVERLEKVLPKMKERCRQLFRLKLEGFSPEEIRAKLGARTVGNVYLWDHRCRQKTLEMLGGDWVLPPGVGRDPR